MSAMKLPCPYCHRCRKELSDGWQYCENCPWHFVNRSWCKKIEQSGSSIGNSTYIVSVSVPLQRRQSHVWYYLKITCDTLKIPQESKKRPSCWEKNERKRLMKLTTMIWKKMDLLWLPMHAWRDDSVYQPRQEIATNPTVKEDGILSFTILWFLPTRSKSMCRT